MRYNISRAARVRWAASAAKHGIDRDDVIHAMTAGPVGSAPEYEASRVPGQGDPWLFVGRTRAGVVIEVLGAQEGGVFVVFHAMRARDKMLAILRRGPK